MSEVTLHPCTTPDCNGALTLRVIEVQLPIASTVETLQVGRCMTCDTMPCPNCNGRTFSPTAPACDNCGHKIQVREVTR